MANLKPAVSDRFVQLVLGLFANERVEFALSDLLEKRPDFAFVPRNLKFYSTIRQVSDPTGHVETFGDVEHSETEPNALDATFIKHLKRDHHLLQVKARHRLFVRIDETETTFLALNRIDRYKILAAVLRSEAGSRFVSVAEILRGHLLSAFVIKADGDLFQRFRCSNRKPILVSSIKIHCDQDAIVWFKRAARMSISNLESVVPKCSSELKCVFASTYFSVCVRAENNARAQRKNQNEKPHATFHFG